MAWLSLGQPSLETDRPSKGVASSTTISKDEAASPVSEHPLWHRLHLLSPALASQDSCPPLKESSRHPSPLCLPTPESCTGAQFLARLVSLKAVLIGGPYHGQENGGSERNGHLAQREIRGTGLGSRVSCIQTWTGCPMPVPAARLCTTCPGQSSPSAACWPHVWSPCPRVCLVL